MKHTYLLLCAAIALAVSCFNNANAEVLLVEEYGISHGYFGVELPLYPGMPSTQFSIFLQIDSYDGNVVTLTEQQSWDFGMAYAVGTFNGPPLYEYGESQNRLDFRVLFVGTQGQTFTMNAAAVPESPIFVSLLVLAALGMIKLTNHNQWSQS